MWEAPPEGPQSIPVKGESRLAHTSGGGSAGEGTGWDTKAAPASRDCATGQNPDSFPGHTEQVRQGAQPGGDHSAAPVDMQGRGQFSLQIGCVLSSLTPTSLD